MAGMLPKEEFDDLCCHAIDKALDHILRVAKLIDNGPQRDFLIVNVGSYIAAMGLASMIENGVPEKEIHKLHDKLRTVERGAAIAKGAKDMRGSMMQEWGEGEKQ